MRKSGLLKKISPTIKEYKYILIVLFLFTMVLFSPTLFFDKEFSWYNDQSFQYNIFYKEWFNIIKETISNKTLSVYSWNTFLGTDFYASKLFTVVGDIFALITFIIFKSINFDLFFCIESILCVVLSAVFMNMFLKKIGIQKQYIRNSFGIVYALSGFACLYTGTYMFHRFYAILPLLFYFTEAYIQNNKLFGFSIITVILFLQNYELMFSASLFLVMYFFISNRIKGTYSISIILKKALPLILSYLVGVLLAGFALVPLIIFLKSNSRVGELSFGNVLWSYQTLVSFTSNIITNPFSIRNEIPPYLFFSDSYYGFEYSFYTTPIIVFALVTLIKNGNLNEKKTLLISELIVVICALIRPLNMIIHGFSVPTFRWLFILVIMNIIISAYVFDKYNYSFRNVKGITIGILIYIVMLIAMMIFEKYSLSEYWLSVLILIVLALSLFIYDYILVKNKKTAMFLMVGNAIVMFSLMIICGQTQSIGKYTSFNQEYIDYYKSEDPDKMFRYYFDSKKIEPYSSANLNSGLNYDYQSTTSYDSAYECVLNDFLISNGYSNWVIDINEPELLKMLGVKYIGITDNKKQLSNLDTEYAYNLDNIEIYKITDYNHIGHTYSMFVNSLESIKDWNNELYVEDAELVADIEPTQKVQLNVVEYNRQYMKATIVAPSKQVLMISIPYSTGWNIVDQNNNSLNQIKVQGGFLGLIVDENIKEINMYYLTPGLKLGLVLTGCGIIGLIVLFIYGRRNKHTQYTN